jgi:putative ABC transport system substrate-binding protein
MQKSRRLPAIHALRGATRDGGLMSYGADLPEVFRQVAAYADRILKGEKPSELPVQAPVKFELGIALGLDAPVQLQQITDEVIE